MVVYIEAIIFLKAFSILTFFCILQNVQMKNQFRELCQTAQQQCLDINADVTEGINEKREQKREKITVNPVDKKEDSIDLLSSLRSLCHIVELQCDSILDNRVSLEHKSLRSLWQRD
jgi:uncharacterized protein (DUF849 family)